MLSFSRLYEVAGKGEGMYYSIIYIEVIANEMLSSIVTADFKVREIFIQERFKCHSLENGRKNEAVFIKRFCTERPLVN